MTLTYIEWALSNFGAYSQGNAKVFADEQARKHGWSSYGDPEYVPHVMRYYQFASLGTSNSKLVNIALSQLGNQGGILTGVGMVIVVELNGAPVSYLGVRINQEI